MPRSGPSPLVARVLTRVLADRNDRVIVAIVCVFREPRLVVVAVDARECATHAKLQAFVVPPTPWYCGMVDKGRGKEKPVTWFVT
jgi:hypothetical protein